MRTSKACARERWEDQIVFVVEMETGYLARSWVSQLRDIRLVVADPGAYSRGQVGMHSAAIALVPHWHELLWDGDNRHIAGFGFLRWAG